MTQIFRPNSDLIRVQPRARVYTKSRWTGQWVEQPHVIPITCLFTLSAVGTATFRYEYGLIIRRGETEPQEIAPLQVRDHWIKIVCEPNDGSGTIVWYGIVTEESHELHGGARAKVSGNQFLTAMSPEYLFSRVQITHSRIRSDTHERYVERSINWNGGKGNRNGTRDIRGNKQPESIAFAEDLSQAEVWSARDITEYLMQFVVKKAQGDTYPMPLRDVQLSLDIPNNVSYLPIEISAEGRTVFDVLNQLWPRSRGLAWRLTFLGTPAMELGFALNVVSLADADVSLPDGQSLPRNGNRIIIDTSEADSVTRNVTQIDQSRRYKQVIAEGGYFGSVFTMSSRYLTLARDWTGDDEDRYKDAASGTAGYGSLDLSDKRTLNDQFRMKQENRHVFTRFKVSSDFVESGEVFYQGLSRPAFPLWVQDAEMESDQVKKDPALSLASQSLWFDGMRFLPYLPMYEGVDYNDANPQPPANTLPNFLRPFGVVKPYRDDDVGLGGNDYYPLDSFGVVVNLDEGRTKKQGTPTSCTIQLHDHQLGLSVVPNGMPHKLSDGVTTWQNTNDAEESHQQKAIASWRDLYVTVYAQSDNRVRYVHPPNPYLIEDDDGEEVVIDRDCDIHSTLLIRLGDRARMDYIAPFTVLGTTNTGALNILGGDIATTGKLIRDDRPFLESVAKMAYAWHSTERRSLSLSLKHLWGAVQVGQLVEQLQHGRKAIIHDDIVPIAWSDGSQWLVEDEANTQVNAVVSSVSYNFERGTTDITTSFAELSFE